jgi:hypothetical protein
VADVGESATGNIRKEESSAAKVSRGRGGEAGSGLEGSEPVDIGGGRFVTRKGEVSKTGKGPRDEDEEGAVFGRRRGGVGVGD